MTEWKPDAQSDAADGHPQWSLEEGMRNSGMTWNALWLRQLSVGGVTGELEVEAYVLGLLEADFYQHDVIAQAINEHFLDNGGDHPVAYWNTADFTDLRKEQ